MAKRKKQKSPEERQAIMAAIASALAQGKGVGAACAEQGISENTYRTWRAGRGKAAARKKQRQPDMLTFQLPEAGVDMPLLIVYGKASDVRHAVDRIAQIKG